MNSIAFDVENEKRFSSRIQKFFRRYQISGILKKCKAYKEQGFSVVTLIQYLFCLVFRNRSMFLDMQSEKAPEFKKDTVYRLKNATILTGNALPLCLPPGSSATPSSRLLPRIGGTHSSWMIPFTSAKAPKRQNCWQRSMTMPATVIPVVSVC